MNIKTILLLTVGMLWSTTVSYAQKVLVYGDNTEIDCREMKGVSRISKGFKTTSTDDISSPNSDEYTSEEANKQIFCRFEVAKEDTGTGEKLWTEALNRCRALEGRDWRLPTHRELTLIMIMSPELYATTKFTLLDLNFSYWSATVAGFSFSWNGEEWNDDSAWTISVNLIGASVKKILGNNPPNKVRCIRELPLN